jgi:hypothetical protein
MNWLREYPLPNSLRMLEEKERELSSAILTGIFPVEFASSTPKAPTRLCGLDLGSFAYYRLSREDTRKESSFRTILASFTRDYAHRDLPLLYSELLDASNANKGLLGTTIGARLAEALSNDVVDEDEEFDDHTGQLELDLLDEVACAQSSDFKLRGGKKRTHNMPYIEPAKDATRDTPFVMYVSNTYISRMS